MNWRRRFRAETLLPFLLVFMILSTVQLVKASSPEAISRRDLVITLGDGVETDAQLTYPAIGEGPFPGVLLIGGQAPWT